MTAVVLNTMLLSRRNWLVFAALALARAASAKAAPSRALVGAIRWDAWYAPGSGVTSAVERSLSPEQYRWRRPFFSRQDETDHVHMPAISQGLMDLEIAQARYAGLDYWAFLAYPSDSTMTAPLRHYLASTQRGDLRFCLFTELSAWGSREEPAPLLKEQPGLMAHEAYLRVENGRPLYYLGFITEQLAKERWGGGDGLRHAIADVRARATASGAGNPYIVVGVLPRDDTGFAASLGADAVGAYTIADGHMTGDYKALTQIARNGWRMLAGTGLPVVPTVMAGWDRRPRVETPVPWEQGQRPGAGLNYFFISPQAPELAAHLREALDWQNAQPIGRRAPAVLIYAWNENDEGGWLVPTAPCDQARLEALHHLLRETVASGPPGCIWRE
jgi:hypothetical protein